MSAASASAVLATAAAELVVFVVGAPVEAVRVALVVVFFVAWLGCLRGGWVFFAWEVGFWGSVDGY